MPSRIKMTVSAIDRRIERIRLYQGFALRSETHTLSPAFRRQLWLLD